MSSYAEKCELCIATISWWRHNPASIDFKPDDDLPGVVDGAHALHLYAGATSRDVAVYAVDQDGDRCGQPLEAHDDGWWVQHGNNAEVRRLFVAPDFWVDDAPAADRVVLPTHLTGVQGWKAIRDWISELHRHPPVNVGDA